MPKVWAWPPVPIAAYSPRITRPGSISMDQKGAPIFSQAQARRLRYTIDVGLLDRDITASGYLDMLMRQMDGALPLVRIQPLPPLWQGHLRGLGGKRGQVPLEWTADGRTLNWDVVWVSGAAITGTAVTDGDFAGLRCSGFAGITTGTIVARPGELVRNAAGQTARVLKAERLGIDGKAVLRLDAPLASGKVVIGAREALTMVILSWSDPVLDLGAGSVELDMLEVTSADFDGEAFTVIDPWS
ncbi:hypothetical protein ACXN5S_19485 [Pseudoroseicyclus sp. H15]